MNRVPWARALAPIGLHTRRAAIAAAAMLLSACASNSNFSSPNFFNTGTPPAQQSTAIGAGSVKVALILPLNTLGNAGQVGQSMRNAAELAVTEFNNPDIALLVKDDGGTAQGAQFAAQQALEEGAQFIIGPLFAQSVQAVGSVARSRNVPVIAFSNDSTVAARGVFLLSFLPESDVNRIVDYAIGQGKRSFVAMVPDNAYGGVVEAEFRQYVARKGGRVMAVERYSADRLRLPGAVQGIAQAAGSADALFLPGDPDMVIPAAQALAAGGVDLRRLQLLGTGLWDDPRIAADATLQGGWYPGPDPNGPNNYRAFAARYRAKYGADPTRTATLAYDAVALVAALIKTQGAGGLTNETLLNPSGFAGIDGVFRFRSDGTNQRSLAILRVTPNGGQVIAPAPRSFSGSGT
ncbi:MAG TPA: penicillin-binding protein activator [Xanthobacteraceae bacterium]|nr:penicillin-binding protein activator [Xanthobacteraceae bacterium]